MRESLPLFPLGAVLFPGVLLPLHIFEPRYRELVQDLVALPDGQPREFGVVAIREGREVGPGGVHALYRVGCTAVLASVTALPDGAFDIVCVGSRRFRLHGVEPAGTAYLTASVERLDDAGSPGDDARGLELRARAAVVARRFDEYRELLGAEGDVSDPDDAQQLSFLVAAAMRLDLGDRQALLQAPDTASRLAAELALLWREAGLIRELGAIPATDLTRVPYSPN